MDSIYQNACIQRYKNLLPGDKYGHPGVYSITVNGEIVYIGKARDMASRVAYHLFKIVEGEWSSPAEQFKYGELRKVKNFGYDINFNVLYASVLTGEEEKKIIDDDIGPQEAYYINKYLPKLNKQIPCLDNYHKYKTKKYETLDTLLKGCV